jgi:hypothetical protein
MAMPWGLLNEALSPAPFTDPAVPDPAKVVTKPDDDILRILLLSHWNISPPELMMRPFGLLNEAVVPIPSADPTDPDPAMVITVTAPAIIHVIHLSYVTLLMLSEIHFVKEGISLPVLHAAAPDPFVYAHAAHALQPPDDEYEPTLHCTHVVDDEAAMELE